MTPKIYIEPNSLFYNKVKWVMTLVSQYAGLNYNFIHDKINADLRIGFSDVCEIRVDPIFFDKINQGHTSWREVLPDGPVYINRHGVPGWIETIFYYVNCIQELNLQSEDEDHWGRFRYDRSVQFQYGIIEKNLIGEIIEKELLSIFPVLGDINKAAKKDHRFFLSHDIDLIYSGWKVEGYLSVKNKNIPLLIRVLKDIILKKHFYNNIADILKKEKQHNITSFFYWIVNYGKDNHGILNADYTMEDVIQNSSLCLYNGLHKSTFESSFKEEAKVAPFEVHHNRYHFLKFQTHKAWKAIEAAGLKTDASLGFAEHIGFRNSYGLPFTPFDMENDRPYGFVEIPLNVMDGTITQYMGIRQEDALNCIQNFIDDQSVPVLISILWHNNELTDYFYRGMNRVYWQIAEVIKKRGGRLIMPDEIFNQYKMDFKKESDLSG